MSDDETQPANNDAEKERLRAFVRAYNKPDAHRNLLELASRLTEIGYWIYDLEKEQIYWSPELWKIAGVDQGTFDLDLRSAIHCYHPDDRKIVIACAEEAAETGEDFEFEVRVLRPSGEVRHVVCQGTCDVDEDDNVVALFAAFQDITERKSLLGRLMRTQHLASVGSVATGIAHGVNNPLTSLFVNLELAVEELEHLQDDEFDPALLRETLDEARQGAEKVRQVVRGLKAFSREERAQAAPTELRNVVEVALTLTQNELRHQARLETSFEPAPSIRAVRSRLEQVVVGLILHAIYQVKGTPLDDSVVRLSIETEPTGDAVFSLSHNGGSLSQRELEARFREFEPFNDVGGGLGLAVCHAIVHEDGGELAVDVSDDWTTFQIRFKPLSGARLEEESDSEEETVVAKRPARVLVVDDEEIVGNSVSRILPSDEVIVATSGRQALEIIGERGPGAFDIVLCDMMMPGMSGQELFRRIQDEYPTLAERVIFLTGGVFSEEASSFLACRPERWVAKPYDVNRIRSLVARSTQRAEVSN